MSLRISAIGDIHFGARSQGNPAWVAELARQAPDIVLIAGDISDHGSRAEIEDAVALLRSATTAPAVAVLGNHDVGSESVESIERCLSQADVTLLHPGAVRIGSVGIAGTKGFWGGWRDEPIGYDGEHEMTRLRDVVRWEATALAQGLAAIADCPIRIALTHYAPTRSTLAGEPGYVIALLGAEALGQAIRAGAAGLAVHGHAHRGAAFGRIGFVPVINAALPVNRGLPRAINIHNRT
jgi:Icc-related predicted phosphoesterase